MDKKFYIENRKKIMSKVEENQMVILFSGENVRKTADEYFPFFANRSFVYVTGVKQRKSIVTMHKCGSNIEETFFSMVPNELEEVWTGRRLTNKEITEISGVENIRDEKTFMASLNSELTSGKINTIYLCLDRLYANEAPDQVHSFATFIKESYPHIIIKNIFPTIAAFRKIKDPCEIEAIKKAMEITNLGIQRMMQKCTPGMMEYELEAEFNHELAKHGQRNTAFPSIIASGIRNFYLHYPLPMSKIEEGDFVLTDVGAPYNEYCTDISRMFPANGVFTEKQEKVYNIALASNKAIMERIKPGESFKMPKEVCRQVSFEGLKQLGLIDDINDIGKYVWHGTTHHVGLDTHDVGGYEEPMAENMVFTVDSGIYVREWGIGLRIEDNVLVTPDGCENLSAKIPTHIHEIEALMKKS